MKKILVLMACASFMMCACDDDEGSVVNNICKQIVNGEDGRGNDFEILCEVNKNNKAELIASCEDVIDTMPVCKDELIAHLETSVGKDRPNETKEELFEQCINKTDDTYNQYTDALHKFIGFTCRVNK